MTTVMIYQVALPSRTKKFFQDLDAEEAMSISGGMKKQEGDGPVEGGPDGIGDLWSFNESGGELLRNLPMGR